VARLLRAAKKNRHGTRNHAMILIACRQGLRASEVTSPRVSDVDLERRTIYCRRARRSRSGVHPMKRDEAARLEGLLRHSEPRQRDYVFQSERSERRSCSGFWRIVAQADAPAGLPVRAYAHLLRHACGYHLANHGCDLRLIQDYLGHKQIQNMRACEATAHDAPAVA